MSVVRQLREAEMSPWVSSWLSGLGYAVYSEVQVFSGIDHVGIRWSDESIICVEMKCSCSRQLIRQATTNQLATTLSYVALPRMPRSSSLEKLRFHGLGVLVNGLEIFKPEVNPNRHPSCSYDQYVLRACRGMQTGGVGGVPNLKGVGPAQTVARLVNEYRSRNPKATWEEMYREIPNHYSHARSMGNALMIRGLVRNPVESPH